MAPLLIAAITPLTTRMTELVAAEWSRKSNVIAETALQASELDDPEEFCAALSGDSDMIALTQKILWAASVSGNDSKLRAFGNLLGRTVARHGDKIDERQILVNALADLEAPHVIILDVIAESAPDQAAQHDSDGRKQAGSQPLGWLAGQISGRVQLDSEFILACLNTLTVQMRHR